MSLRSDDRGVSVTVNYVLALAVTVLLLYGLLTAAGGVMEDRRQAVSREAFRVLGDQLAAGVADADRLAEARAADVRNVNVLVQLPREVGGVAYQVTVSEVSPPGAQPGEYVLTFAAVGVDASWNVTVRTEHALVEATVPGGPILVSFDDASGDLTLSRSTEVAP